MVWKRMRRAGVCALLGLGVGGLFGLGRGDAQPSMNGQPGVNAGGKKKNEGGKFHTNRMHFNLPVEIDEQTRAGLQEVCLYVKAGSGEWSRKETANAQVTNFTYKVPHDGEFWFSIVTIDRMGRTSPPDLNREQPGLQVVVETQEPKLELQPWVSPEGEICLKCTIVDANPDYQSLKMVYRGNDDKDHTVEAIPNRPGIIRVPLESINQQVLVMAKDLCGNSVVQSHQMKVPAGELPRPTAVSDVVGPVTSASKSEASLPPPLPPDHLTQVGHRVEHGPAKQGPVVAGDWSKGPDIKDPGLAPPPSVGTTIPSKTVPDLSTAPASGPSGRQIVNTNKATLAYRIDQVGPSGIGKVEVYATSDKGNTWLRVAEDADRSSPVEITLPGEGLYGIRLVVTNGNGFGGTQPAKGDQPTAFIEVDTTKPFVQMRDIDPVTKDGCLEINWKASDKNLGNDPVALFYRTRPDMPWKEMARNLKNDGLCRWGFPRDSGSQFYVKIEVTDLAGNVARVECPNPVILDMTVPSASVINISGIQPRPATPPGN